jgi:deoxycytidine triphosphate deaminase
MQLKIFNKIKFKLETLKSMKSKLSTESVEYANFDKSILGNIKYYISETFEHETGEHHATENHTGGHYGDDTQIDDNHTDDNYTDDNQITSDANLDVKLHNSLKIFEIITGNFIDITQYTSIMSLINDVTIQKYKIYEILMGRGKTTIIIPSLIYIYMQNKKFTNILSCLPTHLINQSYKILSTLIPYFTHGYLIKTTINRTDNSYKDLNKQINLNVNKIIILNDTSIKSFILCNKENKENKTNDLLKINDKTLLIMDEFDSLLNPLKSDLNFPIGKDIYSFPFSLDL